MKFRNPKQFCKGSVCFFCSAIENNKHMVARQTEIFSLIKKKSNMVARRIKPKDNDVLTRSC